MDEVERPKPLKPSSVIMHDSSLRKGALQVMIVIFLLGVLGGSIYGFAQDRKVENACSLACLDKGYPDYVYYHSKEACYCKNQLTSEKAY